MQTLGILVTLLSSIAIAASIIPVDSQALELRDRNSGKIDPRVPPIKMTTKRIPEPLNPYQDYIDAADPKKVLGE